MSDVNRLEDITAMMNSMSPAFVVIVKTAEEVIRLSYNRNQARKDIFNNLFAEADLTKPSVEILTDELLRIRHCQNRSVGLELIKPVTFL